MFNISAETLAQIKGMVSGFFFLLFTHKPRTVWNMHEVIRFGRRVGVGLTIATVGTEFVQRMYPEIPTAPAAAVLMAFGMEIVDRFVRSKVEGKDVKKDGSPTA